MKGSREKIFKTIESMQEMMVALQKDLTAVPAIAPESGGEGESAKTRVLEDALLALGLPAAAHYDAPDTRVPSGVRPNLVLSLDAGAMGPSFWIMSHTDIVPPGELSQWKTDPYVLSVQDGKLVGRGVEDNQQSLVASIFALKALVTAGIAPAIPVRLLFVADEETGSDYGIKYLMKNHGKLFDKKDIALVPDAGKPDSTMIEVAEKSIFWLKVHTTGKQIHGSLPHLGKNAFVAASEMVCEIQKLNERYSSRNELFDPPFSTISPTKKEANVPNINTIPGDDVFYVDSRILPEVMLDEVQAEIESTARAVARKHGVTVEFEIVQKESSPPTPADSMLVNKLSSAIKTVYGTQALPMGIGGGTVAAHLRREGIHTAVWSTIESTAHMPNETCIVRNMVNDAKVMALLMTGG